MYYGGRKQTFIPEGKVWKAQNYRDPTSNMKYTINKSGWTRQTIVKAPDGQGILGF